MVFVVLGCGGVCFCCYEGFGFFCWGGGGWGFGCLLCGGGGGGGLVFEFGFGVVLFVCVLKLVFFLCFECLFDGGCFVLFCCVFFKVQVLNLIFVMMSKMFVLFMFWNWFYYVWNVGVMFWNRVIRISVEVKFVVKLLILGCREGR